MKVLNSPSVRGSARVAAEGARRLFGLLSYYAEGAESL